MVNASELKTGSKIGDYHLSYYHYTPGQSFAIKLAGRSHVSGELYHSKSSDKIFFINLGAIDVSSLTQIEYKLEKELLCIPPLGTFKIASENLNVLDSLYGKHLLSDLSQGKRFKVYLVIDEYTFYAENHSSPRWSCKVSEIESIEPI